ncbi:MAG: hypothetical protein EOO02_09260, partial [Chitinophagaceae bacterium]
MYKLIIIPFAAMLVGLTGGPTPAPSSSPSPSYKPGTTGTTINDTLHYPDEKHFKNLLQLTFGGDNAEAYFSYDNKWLIFQKTRASEGIPCDQIYIARVPNS